MAMESNDTTEGVSSVVKEQVGPKSASDMNQKPSDVLQSVVDEDVVKEMGAKDPVKQEPKPVTSMEEQSKKIKMAGQEAKLGEYFEYRDMEVKVDKLPNGNYGSWINNTPTSSKGFGDASTAKKVAIADIDRQLKDQKPR